MAAHEIIHHGRQVFVPVHQEVKELVEPGHDRRDGETEAQDCESLARGLIG